MQFGVDTLLQDKQVIHVSFDQQSANVITWYQDIFTEIAKKKNIANINELVTELVRKRIILNFHQDAMALSHIVTTLEALAQGGIQAACLVVDGVDLSKLKADEVQTIADYAKKAGIAVWFSASSEATDLNGTLAADLQGLFQAVIRLDAKTDMIELMILKLRDEAARASGLKLDSKTLLIAEK